MARRSKSEDALRRIVADSNSSTDQVLTAVRALERIERRHRKPDPIVETDETPNDLSEPFDLDPGGIRAFWDQVVAEAVKRSCDWNAKRDLNKVGQIILSGGTVPTGMPMPTTPADFQITQGPIDPAKGVEAYLLHEPKPRFYQGAL
jgi:hypothetical protein